MAITLRHSKGSPLTHTELDANFQEFYYSASYSDYHISLFKSRSLGGEFTVPVNVAKGPKYSIQLKTGNQVTGSEAAATGSSRFTYDFDNDKLSVTGSAILSGSGNILTVKGSGDISGDLVVGGTVTAQEFKSELVNSSIIYQSGSTKFGDTSDDNHDFTGSINLLGSATLTGDLAISGHANVSSSISSQSQRLDILESKTLVSASAQIADNISGSLSNSAIQSLGSGIISASSQIADLGSGIISSSNQIAADISGSYVLTNTKIQDLGAGIISASSQVADLGANIPSSSTQIVSLIENQNVNLGIVSASSLYTEIVSSSVIFSSGSNIFGDASGDTHTFTGSVLMSSTLAIEGFPNVSESLAASVAATGANWNVNLINIPDGLVSSSIQVDADTITNFDTNVKAKLDADQVVSGSNISFDGSTLAVTGAITATSDITAYQSSDERLKDNITPIENALEKVNLIGGYEFDWNNKSTHEGHDVGVIAQQIEKVMPEIVIDRDNGFKAVRYEKIVALLINAIKEQQLQIDELKSKL